MIHLTKQALVREVEAIKQRQAKSKVSQIREALENGRGVKERVSSEAEIKALRAVAYQAGSRRGKVSTQLFTDEAQTPSGKVYTLYIYPAEWKREFDVLLTRRDLAQ